MRSNTSTFASTAIPTVSAKPAIPGSVSVALIQAMAPSRMTAFDVSAKTAFRPASL